MLFLRQEIFRAQWTRFVLGALSHRILPVTLPCFLNYNLNDSYVTATWASPGTQTSDTV